MNEKITYMEKAIEELLAKFPEEKREPAMRLREILLKAQPSITETIKWGNLTFVHGKTNLVFIYTYKTVDYINCGFMQATSLQDPKNLFEGTGAGMRHIKIRTVKDIPVAQVKAWIKEAVLLAEVTSDKKGGKKK
jgi:hypothetical protein